ncbi:MAG: hypothetical protein AAFU54_25755 [Chloroflexota bacterium]
MKYIIGLLAIVGMAFAGIATAGAQCDNTTDPDIITCSGEYFATVGNDAINQGYLFSQWQRVGLIDKVVR